MPLPTKAELQTLNFSYRGSPFCIVEAKSITSKSLDYSYRGSPFVGTAPAVAGGFKAYWAMRTHRTIGAGVI